VSGPLFGTFTNDIRQQYTVTGDAFLAHQIGRTWRLAATYHRGLSSIEGFQTPMLTDGVTTTLGGFLNRRVDFTTAVSYTNGTTPLTVQRSRLLTYTGDAQLRYALTRVWAAYVEYLYYFYDFDRSLQLPGGVTPRMQRNMVRVGLTTWVPIWRRK
jgi:hypothetical protein